MSGKDLRLVLVGGRIKPLPHYPRPIFIGTEDCQELNNLPTRTRTAILRAQLVVAMPLGAAVLFTVVWLIILLVLSESEYGQWVPRMDPQNVSLMELAVVVSFWLLSRRSKRKEKEIRSAADKRRQEIIAKYTQSTDVGLLWRYDWQDHEYVLIPEGTPIGDAEEP